MVFLLLLMFGTIDLQNTEQFIIPQKYQHPTTITLHTVNTQAQIDKECGAAPKGYDKVGCDNGKDIWLMNPCLDKSNSDPESYARSLCHEIGHSEGWHHVNE